MLRQVMPVPANMRQEVVAAAIFLGLIVSVLVLILFASPFGQGTANHPAVSSGCAGIHGSCIGELLQCRSWVLRSLHTSIWAVAASASHDVFRVWTLRSLVWVPPALAHVVRMQLSVSDYSGGDLYVLPDAESGESRAHAAHGLGCTAAWQRQLFTMPRRSTR